MTTQTNDTLITTLSALVARVTDTPADRIGAGARFDELAGWGSLASMRLLSSVERRFEVRMDLRSWTGLQTVGELEREIRALLPADDSA